MRLFVKDRTDQSSSQVMQLTESGLIKPRSVIENEKEIFNELTLSLPPSATHAL